MMVHRSWILCPELVPFCLVRRRNYLPVEPGHFDLIGQGQRAACGVTRQGKSWHDEG